MFFVPVLALRVPVSADPGYYGKGRPFGFADVEEREPRFGARCHCDRCTFTADELNDMAECWPGLWAVVLLAVHEVEGRVGDLWARIVP